MGLCVRERLQGACVLYTVIIRWTGISIASRCSLLVHSAFEVGRRRTGHAAATSHLNGDWSLQLDVGLHGQRSWLFAIET